MQKVTTFLWFNDRAEEAARFYVSIFPNSKIVSLSNSSTGIMSVTFSIEGTEFIAFNGGPTFQFNPAISLFVNCKTQKEVDTLWEKLTQGGEEVQCGWLHDKFGVFWQIVPTALGEVLGGEDAEGSQRALQAMLKMKKLDIAGLKQAYAGKQVEPKNSAKRRVTRSQTK